MYFHACSRQVRSPEIKSPKAKQGKHLNPINRCTIVRIHVHYVLVYGWKSSWYDNTAHELTEGPLNHSSRTEDTLMNTTAIVELCSHGVWAQNSGHLTDWDTPPCLDKSQCKYLKATVSMINMNLKQDKWTWGGAALFRQESMQIKRQLYTCRYMYMYNWCESVFLSKISPPGVKHYTTTALGTQFACQIFPPSPT